jgi:hypothetical protein
MGRAKKQTEFAEGNELDPHATRKSSHSHVAVRLVTV